jgi:hypothetical protein
MTYIYQGRDIAQAVNRHLPTAAGRVRAQVRSCGNCGGQSGTGVGFLRELRFPLPILIPPTAPHSPSSIIQGWYNRPVSGDVPSGFSLTPPQETKLTTYIKDAACVLFRTLCMFCYCDCVHESNPAC